MIKSNNGTTMLLMYLSCWCLVVEVCLCCIVFLFFQNFLNSSSCPEIQGFLYVKEPGRKSWKKLYMLLRRSGLYYSNKGMSKVADRKETKQMFLTLRCSKVLWTELKLLGSMCSSSTGTQTPAAALRSGRQQHLHHHHRQEASQCSHRVPVLHQGDYIDHFIQTSSTQFTSSPSVNLTTPSVDVALKSRIKAFHC